MRRLRVRPSQPGLGRHRPAQLRGSVRQRAGGAEESGGNPVESRAFEWAPLSVSRRRSRVRRKNAAVERREARRSALWAGSSLPPEGPARPRGGPRGAAFRTSAFRRSAPSRLGSKEIPAHPAPCENRGGGALAFFARRLFET